MENKELKTRVVTAAVLFIIILLLLGGSAFFSWGRWLLAVLMFVINVFCCYEFAKLSVVKIAKEERKRRLEKGCIYFLITILPGGLVFFLVSYLWNSIQLIPTLLMVAGPGIFCFLGSLSAIYYMIIEGRDALSNSENIAKDLFVGIFLLGGCASTLMAYTVVEGSWKGLLWLILIVCSNDIAAYFCGKKIGGPKMAPVISPNKTISGSIAGLLVGTAVGLIAGCLLPASMSWISVLVFSIGAVAAAQVGDLSKSYLKRLHGSKDMGSLLPGHGGVLDRVDGILMAGPVMVLAMADQWLFV